MDLLHVISTFIRLVISKSYASVWPLKAHLAVMVSSGAVTLALAKSNLCVSMLMFFSMAYDFTRLYSFVLKSSMYCVC